MSAPTYPCDPTSPCGCDGCSVLLTEDSEGCGCACSPMPEPERCVLGCGHVVDQEGDWCGGAECRSYARAEARGEI